jgi:hypothetical protein
MVASIGDGEKVVAKGDSQDMAENSETSQKSAKRSTPKTVKLTPEQALEILQQSLFECQQAGISVQVMPDFYSHGQRYLAILVASVALDSGSLRLIGGKNG